MPDNVMTNKVTIESEMLYRNERVLHYTIEYPYFTQIPNKSAQNRMNQYYKMKAEAYQRHCQRQLYSDAVKEYEDSIKNNFPFRMFEALEVFEITYNMDCTVSLFSDRYEFTGGAHGNTIRDSDTWNIQRGYRTALSQYFVGPNYKAYIIQSVISQIEEQIKTGENQYFENYRELVVKTFDPNSFYLTEEGISVYFQQYDIAPYSSGIPVFPIPYENGKVLKPKCSRP